MPHQKNAMKDHNNKSDNPNTERNWRNRRLPVKLGDFLMPDGDADTAVSDVTPVVSGYTSTQNPNEPTNQSFAATTEDFPAVGAKRSKKLKTTPVTTTTTAVADNSSQPSTSTSRAAAQGTGKYHNNNQKVVNKWLQKVQPPEVQSQQIPAPLPPLKSHHESSSAPHIAPQIQATQNQHSTFTPPAPRPTPTPTSTPTPTPTQRVNVNRPFTPRPTQPISTSGAASRMPRDVHSAPANPNVSARPIGHNNLPTTTATPNRKEMVNLAASSGTSKRFHERRLQREQLSQLPDELMMLPENDAPNSGTASDASFLRELHQAIANNPLTRNPLDIASESSLNCNALEFRPRRQVLTSDENQASKQGAGRRHMITERRRRQRFNRTLRPDALFELVATEETGMSESTTGESQGTPSAIVVPQNGSSMISPLLNTNTNNDATEITDCPAGQQEDSIMEESGNTFDQQQEDSPTLDFQQEKETFDSQQEDSPIIEESGQTLDFQQEKETFDSQQEDSPMIEESGQTLDFQQEKEASSSLLDMDPESTQQTDASLCLALNTSNNKQTQPRHMLFLKGNAERHTATVDLNFMPSSVKKLYRLICGMFSDYAFVYTLSAQQCRECVPMDCYVYLKMALLISLTSIEADELRPPISLCVICTDSCVTHQLLNSVGQLAPRFIGPHEGGQQPSFSGLPPRFNWVQASPLMLAQQGVYYAGDWNRLSRDQTDELEKSMENNSLPIPQLQSEQPLEAAIWTYWQPENAANQSTAFAKLCPIFGLPVYMDEPHNEVLWDFALRKHTRDSDKVPKDAFLVPFEDMRTMLELIQQREVFFTQPAEHLLKKYYIISRAKQPTAFSSKTYVVLKQFAESVAKLSMRLDVLESDVVVAIFHCEHFVRSIFGAGEFPPPNMNSSKVISRVDPYMNIFSRWLFQYMDRYEDKVV